MKALVVAELYPTGRDPVLGVWAHRQALAARDAGADVRVVVLHRLVPPKAALRAPWRLPGEVAARLGEPRVTERDGLEVRLARFASPARSRWYATWDRWAAPALRRAAEALTREGWRPDVVHAHNAVPSAGAVLRAGLRAPLVVSVHGGDVHHVAPRMPGGEDAVRRGLEAARLVLANSRGTAARCEALGAAPQRTRVVHLGTDVPPPRPHDDGRTVAVLGHVIERKRHADVLRAVARLGPERAARVLVVGDGPQRPALEALARELGVDARFVGQLPHVEALAALRDAAVLALPSTDEAFGVAYVEAMAVGMPAIGADGEPGPAEIAQHGDGLLTVPAGDVEALAALLDRLLADGAERARLGAAARATVQRAFTWERCGEGTVAAYAEAAG